MNVNKVASLQGTEGKRVMRTWVAAAGLLTVGMGAAHGTTLTTLASFTGVKGAYLGSDPRAGLLLDDSGNLYGTTSSGGSGGRGTVFKLTKATNYSFATLLNFIGTNGGGPVADLMADGNGNLYGTTMSGGSLYSGNTFKLTKTGSSYTASTLATFTGNNGEAPASGLIADASGNLFGSTNGGGANGYGTAYQLVKSSTGYTTKTLANFSEASGGNPFGDLVADDSGNLFGTTNNAGPGGNGTVFELVKTASGYTLQTLVSFNVTNGANPYGGLLLDKNGDLFGTTYDGGPSDAGTVFKLTKASGYKLSTLVTFTTGNGIIAGGLIQDAVGNLFGTTLGNINRGGGANVGSVFELAKGTSGYKLNTLVTFNGTNGASPYAGLVADSNGDLYGTTSQGGKNNTGTIFKVSDSGFVTASPIAVAEPTSMSLIAIGIVGALVWRRRATI